MGTGWSKCLKGNKMSCVRKYIIIEISFKVRYVFIEIEWWEQLVKGSVGSRISHGFVSI